jgi:alkylated DNA nucleotide flippase Atl1
VTSQADPNPPGSVDRAVLLVVGLVPSGALVSYGDVSRILTDLGMRCTARQVAHTLRQHGGAPGVAWWRVVQSAGTVAEPVAQTAAPLLALEGIDVRERRVPLAQRRWHPHIEDLQHIGESLAAERGRVS